MSCTKHFLKWRTHLLCHVSVPEWNTVHDTDCALCKALSEFHQLLYVGQCAEKSNALLTISRKDNIPNIETRN